MIEEVKKGRLHASGKMAINVMKHKTNIGHGPAMLIWPQDLYDGLIFFINNVRPFIPNNSNYVFITSNGTHMEPGDVSKQLDSVLKKAGVYGENPPPKKIGGNILRKSTSTGVSEKMPENQNTWPAY